MRLISQLVENHDGERRQDVIPLFSQGQTLRKQESRERNENICLQTGFLLPQE